MNRTLTFDSQEERDEFLNTRFPDRQAQDAPGTYAIEQADGIDGTPAGEVVVFGNEVTLIGAALGRVTERRRLYTAAELRDTAAYYRNAAAEAEKVDNGSAAADFSRTAARFEAKAEQQDAEDREDAA